MQSLIFLTNIDKEKGDFWVMRYSLSKSIELAQILIYSKFSLIIGFKTLFGTNIVGQYLKKYIF